MLESLARTDVPSFWKAAQEISGHCDPFMLFRVLSTAFRIKNKDNQSWDFLLSIIPSQSRWLLDYVLPCVKENERTAKISSLRGKVHDAAQRFFLALLLNVPTREELLKLVAERFPGQAPAVSDPSLAGGYFSGKEIHNSCCFSRFPRVPIAMPSTYHNHFPM